MSSNQGLNRSESRAGPSRCFTVGFECCLVCSATSTIRARRRRSSSVHPDCDCQAASLQKIGDSEHEIQDALRNRVPQCINGDGPFVAIHLAAHGDLIQMSRGGLVVFPIGNASKVDSAYKHKDSVIPYRNGLKLEQPSEFGDAFSFGRCPKTPDDKATDHETKSDGLLLRRRNTPITRRAMAYFCSGALISFQLVRLWLPGLSACSICSMSNICSNSSSSIAASYCASSPRRKTTRTLFRWSRLSFKKD